MDYSLKSIAVPKGNCITNNFVVLFLIIGFRLVFFITSSPPGPDHKHNKQQSVIVTNTFIKEGKLNKQKKEKNVGMKKNRFFFLEKSKLTFPNLFTYLYLYFRNSIKAHSKFKFCCDQKTKSDRWFTFTVILFGKNNHLILNTSTVYFSHTVIGK